MTTKKFQTRFVPKSLPSKLGKVAWLAPLLMSAACSTPDKHSSEPEWIHSSARTVDNGYIVFVSQGEDRFAERARFKAEAAALQDLANECSFVTKGTRLEDRFERVKPVEDGEQGANADVLHQAFSKVGVEFQVCEEAKKTIDPEQVRKLANATMQAQVQKYQDMIGEQNDTPVDSELTKPVAVAQASTTSSGGSPPPILIRDDEHWFMVRQEVAYQKQTVILAPPNTYQPGSPQTNQYMTSVQGPTTHLQNYQASHPIMVRSAQTWSSLHPRTMNHVPEPVLSGGAEHGRELHAPNRPGSGSQAPRSYPKGGGRGRRRHMGR